MKVLDEVLSWFEQLKPPSVSQKDWFQCKLALAEGFTNAVRHAHKSLPTETPIKIEVTLYSDRLEIRVWDCGPPFDFKAHLANLDQECDTNELLGGGRGIGIMQEIADILSYERVDNNHNCLLILKYYASVEKN